MRRSLVVLVLAAAMLAVQSQTLAATSQADARKAFDLSHAFHRPASARLDRCGYSRLLAARRSGRLLRRCPPSPYSLPMADEASAQARGNEMVPGGYLRATHDDRNRVVELLRVAAGDGRLTLEELDQRVGAALTARTYGELAALVSDLPAAPASPAGAPEAKPKDLVRIDCHSASTRRDGPWMVPRRMQVQVTGGSVTLDFTEAVTWWPSLQLDVEVRAGSLRLVTKPGIVVNTDDLAVQASSVKVHAPWGPGVPVRFRIDVAGTVAGGGFKARPPRRTLWQWLWRRPMPAALPPGRT